MVKQSWKSFTYAHKVLSTDVDRFMQLYSVLYKKRLLLSCITILILIGFTYVSTAELRNKKNGIYSKSITKIQIKGREVSLM